jgi:type II secretory pathway predicted ATPase ExeA
MAKLKDFTSRFEFHSIPFTCEIRNEDRYVNDIYETPIEHLHRTLDKRMCAALIAPAGTGKTAVLRALVSRLPEVRYRVHYVKVTNLSKRDMCREIATVCGVEHAGNYPALVKRLQDHFSTSLTIDGLRPVLILDEAHDIRPDVLAIMRILTNFDMDNRLVVSIVLTGQPPLSKLLQHPNLEAVTHRLAHCATLRLLSRTETAHYVEHRCGIAGASSCPFDAGAMQALYEIGRGNLRATDQLSLKSLEVAHEQDCDVVNSNHVVEARRLLWP